MEALNAQTLIEQLDAPEWNVRQAAAEGLQALDADTEGLSADETSAALDKLRYVLQYDDDHDVRGAALRAIAQLEKDASALASELPNYLDSEAWQVRQAAAECLGKQGDSATSQFEKLKNLAATDEDADVRNSAFSALKNINPELDANDLILDLLKSQSTAGSLRQTFEHISANPDLFDLKDTLVQIVKSKDFTNFQKATLLTYESNDPNVTNELWNNDKNGILDIILAGLNSDVYSVRNPSKEWLKYNADSIPTNRREEVGKALKDYFANYGEGLDTLNLVAPEMPIGDLITDLSDSVAGLFYLTDRPDLLGQEYDKHPAGILTKIIAVLHDQEAYWDKRQAAADWMYELAEEWAFGKAVTQEVRDQVYNGLLVGLLDPDVDVRNSVWNALKTIEGDNRKNIEDLLALPAARTRKAATGRFLMESYISDEVDALWTENPPSILQYLLALLEKDDEPAQEQALIWLGMKVSQLQAANDIKLVETAMRRILESKDAGESVKTYAKNTLSSIQTLLTLSLDVSRQKQEVDQIFAVLEDIGAPQAAKIKTLRGLVGSDQVVDYSRLIDQWILWVIHDDTPLVESAAQIFKVQSQSITTLVEKLRYTIPKIEWDKLYENFSTSHEFADIFTILKENGTADLKRYHRVKLLNWMNEKEVRESNFHLTARNLSRILSKTDGPPDGVDDAQKATDEEEIKLVAALLFDEIIDDAIRKQELKVHRRISRLLADMTDRRYAKSRDEIKALDGNRSILETYGVPILGRRLKEEIDLELRESIVRILANVGGTEAVNALATAVVGEERLREERQKLLANYYLEPSLQRSQQAADLLDGVVKKAEDTLGTLQGLNKVVFACGVVILLAGLYLGVFHDEYGTKVTGLIAGIGGFGGVIGLLIWRPLNQIQNAISDLVQIETVFTSFIWELNLNSTFIQSQYVAEGKLNEDEVSKTITRIENAMNLALNNVQTFTEIATDDQKPHLHLVSPPAASPGDTISVFGRNLRAKKNDMAIVINHTPMKSLKTEWQNDSISFTLPADLPGMNGTDGSAWISLQIDGDETNVLPIKITPKA